MKISVILSTYERGDLLRLALLSLNSQTRVPDEVIIIDDGSENDMAASVREYAGGLEFERVRYIRQENRGFRLARSRNNGIREAAGDYIVFWDQDVLATRGYLDLFSGHGRPGQFLVAFPVLLTEKQSGRIGPETVAPGDYSGVLTGSQLKSIRRQYVKDVFYYHMGKLLGRRRYRPKVRGGYFGLTREDLVRVDGFDENYRGWGAEDDDLGRRLYRAGVVGRTVFRDEFPIHLWHPHRTGTGDSPNLAYYNRRLREIARGDFRAVNGLSSPLDDDAPTVTEIR
jgi:GT2 family glycosyltransferase